MSATATTTLKPDETAGFIDRMMKRKQLFIDPKTKGGNKTRNFHSASQDVGNVQQEVSGMGEFLCDNCDRLWMSNFSWMVIDLLNKRIAYKYSHRCKNCLIPEKPTFSTDEFEILVLKAICQYQGKRYYHEEEEDSDERSGSRERRRRRRRKRREDPHLDILCEKCGYGRLPKCWLYYKSQ